MSTPDWFDDRLRIPTPRPVANAWTLHLIRGFVVAAIGFVFGMPILRGDPWRVPSLGVGVSVALLLGLALVERLARRKRKFLRHGTVALARIGRRSAMSVLTWRASYEYPTGPGSREAGSTQVRDEDESSLPDDRFPEGTYEGARFVVLFDPERPARHVIYHPADIVRIVRVPSPESGARTS
ncbi:MAG: hypothetical protein IT460_15380 [Planctomycetes bacterium]|nr:hypothetical protein [Planctomycetota bacterium]